MPLRHLTLFHPKIPAADFYDVAHPTDTAEYPLTLQIVTSTLDGRCYALGQYRKPIV